MSSLVANLQGSVLCFVPNPRRFRHCPPKTLGTAVIGLSSHSEMPLKLSWDTLLFQYNVLASNWDPSGEVQQTPRVPVCMWG